MKPGAGVGAGGAVVRGEPRVDARDDALRGGFFVAGRAVDLAGEVEAVDGLGFEGGEKGPGVDVVVFHAVAGLQHGGVFEAADGLEHGGLGVGGDGHGDAVGVDHVRVEAFGLEPDDVAGFVGEADDFRFERGAVAGAFDGFADVDALVEVGADDVVRGFVGVGGVAGQLFVGGYGGCAVEIAEGAGWVVTKLRLQHGEVDGLAIKAWRRAGFQPPHLEAGAA